MFGYIKKKNILVQNKQDEEQDRGRVAANQHKKISLEKKPNGCTHIHTITKKLKHKANTWAECSLGSTEVLPPSCFQLHSRDGEQ